MIYLPKTPDQIQYLFYSLIYGGLSFFIYDFLRFFRILFHEFYTVKKRGNVHIYVSDVLFFVICAFTFIIFTLTYGYGVIRYYALIGAAIGFALLLNTLGKVTLKIEKTFAVVMKKLLINFVKVPLNFLVKALKKLKYLLYNSLVILHIRR